MPVPFGEVEIILRIDRQAFQVSDEGCRRRRWSGVQGRNDPAGSHLANTITENLHDIQVAFGIEHQAARGCEQGLGGRPAVALKSGRLDTAAGESGDRPVRRNTVNTASAGVRKIQRSGVVLGHAAQHERTQKARRERAQWGDPALLWRRDRKKAHPRYSGKRSIRFKPQRQVFIVEKRAASRFVDHDSINRTERSAQSRMAVDSVAMRVRISGDREDVLSGRLGAEQPGARGLNCRKKLDGLQDFMGSPPAWTHRAYTAAAARIHCDSAS